MSNLAWTVDTGMRDSDLYEMLGGAGDAVFVADQAGLIRFWNAEAKHLLGWSAAEVLLKECAPLLDGCDTAGAHRCTQDCVLIGKARHSTHVPAFDLNVNTASGTRKWINVSIIVAAIGGERLLIHLLRDINAQKQIEDLTKEITVLAAHQSSEHGEWFPEPNRVPSPAVELTPQERKVLQLLSRGLNTARIGRELDVTPATVRNHVQHILQKLDVHTRLEAVLRGARDGLF